MRILIDIGHPAHVHLFRNFAVEMRKRGHPILFVCRDREHVLHLLQHYGFDFRNFGTHYKSAPGKLFGLVKNTLQLLAVSLRFRPDVFISHGSTIGAFVSFLMSKPHIALEDTFNMEQVRLSMLFTDVVLTGDYPHASLGRKEIRYPGYHELAYLHPNVYSPDASVLTELGVLPGEKYAVIRFVAWKASHDIGHKGISPSDKIKLVKNLAGSLKVFISSEEELPVELKKYSIKISPEKMHDAMYYAHIYVGESATMASESAILGTPAVYINDAQFGSTGQQAEYGLLYSYTESETDQIQAFKKASYLAENCLKTDYRSKRDNLLKDKIDLTAFLIWFVEAYPTSEAELRSEGFSFDRFH